MVTKANGLIFLDEEDDIFCLTMQDGAQPLQGVHGNGAIVFQIIHSSGVNAVVIDQGVCGLALLFHGFPQWGIGDQK